MLDMIKPMYGSDLAALGDDPAELRSLRDHFARFVHPEFEVQVTFAAPDSPLRGADALVQAWGKWLSVFSSYRPCLQEVVDVGDGRIALFGRDAVATRDGLEMRMPVGAIYEVRDGLVVRARFFPGEASARAEIA